MSKDLIQWDLLIRHFNDPNDAPLAQQVAAWKDASPENAATFEEIQRIWNLSREVSVLDSLDLKNEIQSLSDRLPVSDKEEEDPGPDRSLKGWKWFWAAAVIVAVATAVSWWLIDSNKVHYLDKITQSGTMDTITLPDNSLIYLDKNSHIRYPDKLPQDTRTVFMQRGNAFFEIAPHPQPFIVRIGTSSITVLGTSFNVRLNGQELNLSVRTGKVRFDTPGRETVLSAGMGMKYNTATNAIDTFDAVNTNEDAWLTRELVFVDASLTEVCKKMETFYNVKISFQGNVPLRKLNATFKNSRLEEVLEILEAAYPVKVTQQDNNIIIKSK